MAKLINMFFILIAIQAMLLLYYNPTTTGGDPGSSIWEFIMNIDNWNSLGFILAMVGIAAGIGLVGVAASAIFAFKTDFLIFAAAIPGFISMGVIFVNLANVFRDFLTGMIFTDCLAVVGSCAAVNTIVALTIGPFAFYYVWTIVEWWRGKDY